MSVYYVPVGQKIVAIEHVDWWTVETVMATLMCDARKENSREVIEDPGDSKNILENLLMTDKNTAVKDCRVQ